MDLLFVDAFCAKTARPEVREARSSSRPDACAAVHADGLAGDVASFVREPVSEAPAMMSTGHGRSNRPLARGSDEYEKKLWGRCKCTRWQRAQGIGDSDVLPPCAASEEDASLFVEATMTNGGVEPQSSKPAVAPAGGAPEPGEGKRWWDRTYVVADRLLRSGIYRHLPRPLRNVNLWLINRLLLEWQLDDLRRTDRQKPYEDFVVPEAEHVSLPVTAVVEFYTPTYAPRLAKMLRRKGWVGGRLDILFGNDPLSFLKATRQGGGFGGWTSLATLVSRGSGYWGSPGATRRQQLPPDVDLIELYLISLGRSITVVVANITWAQRAADGLNRVLHADHPPRITGRGKRRTVQSRKFAAIDAVQAERARLKSVARRWLASELPGIFATDGKGELPVLDVLLTELYNPVSRERPSLLDGDYLRALGLREDTFDRVLPEVEGIRLTEYRPDRERSSPSGHWVLNARYADVFNDELRGNHGKSPTVIGHRVQRSTRDLFTRLALFDLLDLIAARLGAERDLAAATYGKRPVRSAKRLRRQVLSSSFDLAHLADDIEHLTSSKQLYEWEVASIEELPGAYARDGDLGRDDRVLERFAKRQNDAVATLRSADGVSREMLQTATALSANIESVRTQRLALFVGLLSLAAATLALSNQASAWVMGLLKLLIAGFVAITSSVLGS